MAEAEATVSTAELADYLDLSIRGVTEAERRGAVVKAGRGRYALKASVSRYIADLRRQLKEHGGANAASERAKLATAQAEFVALKSAKARGELVPAADVERRWTDVLRAVRGAMLSLPARLGARLPHLTQADLAKVDEAARDALTAAGHADAG